MVNSRDSQFGHVFVHFPYIVDNPMCFIKERVCLLPNPFHPCLDDGAALIETFLHHCIQLHQLTRAKQVGHCDDITGDEGLVTEEVAFQVLDHFADFISPLPDCFLVHWFACSSGNDQLVRRNKNCSTQPAEVSFKLIKEKPSSNIRAK